MNNYKNKYCELIEYLRKNNNYWLENDKWNFMEPFFIGSKIYNSKYIDFAHFKSENIKNEIKYYVYYSFNEKYIKNTYLLNISYRLKHLSRFLEKYYNKIESLNDISDDMLLQKYKMYLLTCNITTENSLNISSNIIGSILKFIKNFYDCRDETEKDIWYSNNIQEVIISKKTMYNGKNNQINFCNIPLYYRECVKEYLKVIIKKLSWSHCHEIVFNLKYFFVKFYNNGYSDGFIKRISRKDIEIYIDWVNYDYRDKNDTYKTKFIYYIKSFLKYIQISKYKEAPREDVNYLILKNDIPKRKVKKANENKGIPEYILNQLDDNINELDRPEFILVYILVRETSMNISDILNLRYTDCIKKIWNYEKKIFEYYLYYKIGEENITININTKIAILINKKIKKVKEISTGENNIYKYLFNIYEGRFKGSAISKENLTRTIKRLIVKKDIRCENGELYNFKINLL